MLLHFVQNACCFSWTHCRNRRFGSQFQARSLELCLFVSKTLSGIETDDLVLGKPTELTA